MAEVRIRTDGVQVIAEDAVNAAHANIMPYGRFCVGMLMENTGSHDRKKLFPV